MTSMRGREFQRLDLNFKLSNAVRNDCCLVLINNRQCVELSGIVWVAVLAHIYSLLFGVRGLFSATCFLLVPMLTSWAVPDRQQCNPPRCSVAG